ncbi:hypothetical protein LINPERHAP1_LOCUS21622 [Linum perenne]
MNWSTAAATASSQAPLGSKTHFTPSKEHKVFFHGGCGGKDVRRIDEIFRRNAADLLFRIREGKVDWIRDRRREMKMVVSEGWLVVGEGCRRNI